MWLLAYMLCIHFVADFLLQTREMGKQKSYVFKMLLAHVGIQFAMFAILLLPFLGWNSFIFAFCNALIHGVIDWHIWRGYKWITVKRLEGVEPLDDPRFDMPSGEFKFWEDHLFFTTIGLDQLLHGLTLVLLFAALV